MEQKEQDIELPYPGSTTSWGKEKVVVQLSETPGLKEEVPKFRHRVVALSGDCALPGLGLSETDRLKLVDQVNIVFHGAATVRFDERIDVAIGINASGTKNMLELARNMIGLKR
ncbi:unnamed protein product [Timema podura]|uniref:Fatty acyl-CoA reductase n=1 Tax=Timema podura TaxID=61482 RepID=A0ABN7NP70_TIMPD|nr:unnamed protein product [Timema podura]